MNLGIAGRWALVCAASKGVNVVITARGEQVLNKTANQLRANHHEVTVIAVTGDITTPAALAAHKHFDILVNNAGGPPPGDFLEWNRGRGSGLWMPTC